MNKLLNRIPFRVIFIVPLTLLIITAVSLTWYISFLNSKNAVRQLASDLHTQVSDRITQHLNSFLSIPPMINNINMNALKMKQINLNNIDNLQEYFIEQIKLFKEIVSSGIATESREYISSAGNLNEIKDGYAISTKKNNFAFDIFSVVPPVNNKITDLQPVYKKWASYPVYDARLRPFYQKAKQAGKQSWTDVYLYIADVAGIDAVVPIYKGKVFQGVLFTSLMLNSISRFIRTIDISENGSIFITDRKGLIIATSSPRKYYDTRIKNRLLYVERNGDPLMKETINYLNSKFGSLTGVPDKYPFYFEFSGEKQFGRVVSYKDKYGLDWLIFTVIPEKDFMNQIYNGNQNTIILVIFLLFLFIIIATIIILVITRPIILLTQSTKEFAEGNLSKRVQVNRNDEIGELGSSFNYMADQLQSSFSLLQASEEKFKKLFDISPLATIILDAESKKIMSANPAFEKTFEYEVSEMLGKTALDLNIITQNDRDIFGSSVELEGKMEANETYFTSKSGKRIEAIAYLIPIIIDGKNYHIGMSVDITKLKRTEEELRKLNEELDSRVKSRTLELEKLNTELEIILKGISDGITAQDGRENLIYANDRAAKIVGFDNAEEFLKAPISEVMNKFIVWDESGKPLSVADLPGRMAFSGQIVAETILKFKVLATGEEKWSIVSASPIFDENGSVLMVINTFRDITQIKDVESDLVKTIDELKTTQSMLVQSEKMASLGILTAGIAHEINNPINYINASIHGLNNIINDIMGLLEKYGSISLGNCSTKLKEIADYKEKIEFNEIAEGIRILTTNIEIGVSRTSEIVKGLKTFSRNDEGSKGSFDINTNIDLTLMLLNNQLGNINIIREYGILPEIMCYSGKINQVFMNLLSNSIDSIKCKEELTENEEIKIRTEIVNENWVKIKISDTGTGIPTGIQNNIFEPFFTTKDVGKGTGLGLAITLGIIKNHNGQIMVQNNIENGVTFTLLLPVKE
jgi:PAS domain S-box-containing protein